MSESEASLVRERLRDQDGGIWQSGSATGPREECELCETESNDTDWKYGLVVCPACDETYLP